MAQLKHATESIEQGMILLMRAGWKVKNEVAVQT